MWSYVTWRDILPSALLLAALTIYFSLTTAIIVYALTAVGVVNARRDSGPRL
jgi:hypothetical protein